jgi:large subunit ribosomal protein L13
MKTYSAKAEEVQRNWWLIDAAGQPLGRVAVKAANLLRGKNKAIFTPHVDTGDFVVVVNASQVAIGGKKETAKTYMSFSGFVGGHKSETFRARRERRPELLVERAPHLPHPAGADLLDDAVVAEGGADHALSSDRFMRSSNAR